jgi:hypothetical protein
MEDSKRVTILPQRSLARSRSALVKREIVGRAATVATPAGSFWERGSEPLERDESRENRIRRFRDRLGIRAVRSN